MLYRLRSRLNHRWFDLWIRRVLRTPPVRCDPAAGFVLLTQLCHRDVLMYLLALKSFVRFLAPRRILVLDDGTLTPPDVERLRAHVPEIEISPVAGFRSPRCPPGGTWERLLCAARMVPETTVVQLDADTLSLATPEEVRGAIRTGTSFTLGTPEGQRLAPVAEASERARRIAASDGAAARHVQTALEAALDGLPRAADLRYVRGSSGFAGYAGGSFGVGEVEAFADAMSRLVGAAKFAEWGSEQVASNFLVANAPAATVLPFPKYAYFHPALNARESAFLHFIGTYRFRKGVYRRLGRAVLDSLDRIP